MPLRVGPPGDLTFAQRGGCVLREGPQKQMLQSSKVEAAYPGIGWARPSTPLSCVVFLIGLITI